MTQLLYFGAGCGIVSAVIGAYTHDLLTVLVGLLAGMANYAMAEAFKQKE